MTTIAVEDHRVEISRPDKVLFPDAGITKLDLAEHYRRVADRMIGHVQGHPLALVRYPNGIEGPRFFQKSAPDHFPDWISRLTLPKREGGETDYVLCCDDARTLVFLANQACIEIHALLARRDTPERPDRLIFDLDPTIDDFSAVRDGARMLLELLTDLGFVPYLMTSGSRGLHIYAPLTAEDDFDVVKRFARDVGAHVSERDDRFTIEHRKADRGDRVFVDYLRNGYGAHSVAPYSVRGKPGAPVATPIPWAELDDPELGPQRYTLRDLDLTRDPWTNIRQDARPLSPAREALRS